MQSTGQLAQIVDGVAVGVAVVDAELRVLLWNRWMEDNSGIDRSRVLSRTLAEVFPDLDVSIIRRKVRQVLELGHVAFFDAGIHGNVFPFPNEQRVGRRFDTMRQSCVLTPLREEDGSRTSVCMTLTDQTDFLSAELALKEVSNEIEQRSRRDPLTGLFHRGYICERIDHELKRIRRQPVPLSVLLLDLDWFKTINDTWGHLAGDEVLRSVARTLSASSRESDLLGRYGGEEFIVVMPSTDEASGQVLAERFRKGIAKSRVSWEGQEIRVTASLGVAQCEPNDDVNRLLSRADAALYDAKKAGRDSTRIATIRIVEPDE